MKTNYPQQYLRFYVPFFRCFYKVNFKKHFLLKFSFFFFLTTCFCFFSKAQVDTSAHKYYVERATLKSSKPIDTGIHFLPPPDGCVINGTPTVTAGQTYTYTLVCSDASSADYWEVDCGTTISSNSEQITIQWDIGCTYGNIRVYTYDYFASKSITITPAAPPAPPEIVYTPLFNSANFIKTIDLSKPVGVVAGAANAGNGAVSYTIPVAAPSGTNGVQPSVSINYNSMASSGCVGYGWNISGLSAISRSGKNIYHNGIVQPVKYNTEDAFVLDGMRLNAITGSNGANETIYAGESETFAKIISKTSGSANNPDWFQVITKDGTTLEFGHTIDSRIKTEDGLNVILWRLNRSIDIKGNFIDYIYDNTDRDSRIKTIKYTGNTNTGLNASNSINFEYAVRADANTVYDAGSSLVSKYLLKEILVKPNNDLIFRTYQFNYGFDNVTSFLKEVIEKGTDGTALNSTIFLYGDKPQNIVSTSSGVLTGPLTFISGDYNADGKTDLLSASYVIDDGIKYHTAYSVYSAISQNSATVLYSNTPLTGNTINSDDKNIYNFLSSDYNGDGRDDILLSNTSIVDVSTTEKPLKLNGITVNYTNSSSFNSTNFPLPAGNYQYSKQGKYFIPGDFDGDGNQDYILILSTYPTRNYPNPYAYHYKAFLTSPSKSIINSEILDFGLPTRFSPDAGKVASAENIVPSDFDGDGKIEILVVTNQEANIISIGGVSASTGYLYQASISQTITTINKDCKLFPGDFNGDKKTICL